MAEDHIYTAGRTIKNIMDVFVNESNSATFMPESQEKRLQCHICMRVLGHRSSLYKHLKYIHKIDPAHRLTINCGEEGCNQSFPFIYPFRKHLTEQHGFTINIEKYFFNNMSDFSKWKMETEQEENVKFIVSTGPRSSKSGKNHYFRCQRTGTYRPEIKKRQSMGTPSSASVGCHCIASMFVVEEESGVTVDFCRTHYGHEVYNTMADDKSSVQQQMEEVTEQEIEFSNLDNFLSKNDKAILISAIKENEYLLRLGEELLFETEESVVLSIPPELLATLVAQDEKEKEKHTTKTAPSIPQKAPMPMSDSESETDEEQSPTRILQSLGNGVFLDTTSNKKIRIAPTARSFHLTDSLPPETRVKWKGEDVVIVNTTLKKEKQKIDERDNDEEEEEEDEDEEMNAKTEQDALTLRDKVLEHLQAILVKVNGEENVTVLADIESRLQDILN